MVVLPEATAVARPLLPELLLMVAYAVLEELQVDDDVRSWVVLSEYLPVALNCRVVPAVISEFPGERVIDTSVFWDELLPPPPQAARNIRNSNRTR